MVGTRSAFRLVTPPNVHISVNGKRAILCCTNPGSMEELLPFKASAPASVVEC